MALSGSAHLSELPLLLLLRLLGPQRVLERHLYLHGNSVKGSQRRGQLLLRGRVAFERVIGQLHFVDALSRSIVPSFLLQRENSTWSETARTLNERHHG